MNNWPTALHTAIKNMCGKMEGLCSKYSRTSTISSVTNKPRAVKADEKRLAYLHAGKRKERGNSVRERAARGEARRSA